MTARIGGAPNMDVYAEPIKAAAGAPVDLRAMNLHDRAEYNFLVGKQAQRHYRRHVHFDPVAGVWIQYTADELAERAFDRKWRRLLFTLYGVLVLAAGAAVVLAILQRNGVLS